MKSSMFIILTPPDIEEVLRRKKYFEFLICNQINVLFSYLYVKSKLEEIHGQKVVPHQGHEFLPQTQIC